MSIQTLKKEEIIRGVASFDKIFKRGKKIRGESVTLFVVSSKESQMGVAISRKYKRAVERNQIKRYIREVYRQNKVWFEKKKLFFMLVKPRTYPHIGTCFTRFQI